MRKEKSRNQLCTGVRRFLATSMARRLTVTGDNPGGADRHFWEPA